MARKTAARRRRDTLKREPARMRIATQLPLRTLKPSARRKIRKERAPHLWIYPGLEEPVNASNKNHPSASFLGLPTEIRQHILYTSLNVEDLEVAAAEENATEEEKRRNSTAIRNLRDDRLTGVPFTLKEISLLKVFCRQTTQLCSISPGVRGDMRWVRKRFRRDLISYLDNKRFSRHNPPTLPIAAAGSALLTQGHLITRMNPKKKGKAIQGKIKKSSRGRHRPRKCWACMERHVNRDPMCPMERNDGGRWWMMTKKVGGWKEEKQAILGTKVVFRD